MNTPVPPSARARLLPHRAWPAVLAVTLSLLSLPSAQGQVVIKEDSPNLVPHPPSAIYAAAADGFETVPPYALRFSVTIGNHGTVPLDFKSKTSEEENIVYAMQCTRWVARHQCIHRESTGEFVYHNAPGHNHYHITDFAQYDLRTLTQDGQPDMSPQGLVAGGEKISFCVQDTDPDEPGPLQVYNPIYTLCLEGHQGISPGYSDTYYGGLAGQQIVIDGLPEATYALVVTIDPTHRFFEGPRDDNVAFSKVRIEEGGAVAYEV